MDIKASLLISTYNWPDALDLTFKSILSQKVLPFEILIADDGSTSETLQLINSYRSAIKIPIKHSWHEDIGFRKTIILNEAVKGAEGNYIIQVDGDMILNPYFIQDHIRHSEENYFIKGSRSMLSPEKSKQILKTKNIKLSSRMRGVGSRINGTRFPLLSPLFYGDPSKTNDLRGCNFAFWKSDFVAVNGYNNELNGWGHEDIELAARLVNYGVKRKQLKMSAVCFHIYHKLASRSNEDNNLKVYREVLEKKIIRCANGITQV